MASGLRRLLTQAAKRVRRALMLRGAFNILVDSFLFIVFLEI
jgi:hypothetical protein